MTLAGSRKSFGITTLLVLAAAAAIFAPLFGGYWLGDDYSNLYQLHHWARQDRYWLEAARRFVTAGDPLSAFYRPLMMLSLFTNLAVAGMHYAGWFAFNLAVHLANAVLVAVLVRRLAQRCGREAWLAAPLAAAWFALDPVTSEGVYWISARADAVVTLASLLALLAWSTPRGGNDTRARWIPPLLLLLALGFKESAAVLPLQLGLVALAWPVRPTRAQVQGCVIALVLMFVYLAVRAFVFGNAWNVYHGPQRAGLLEALASLPAWWQGLGAPAPRLAAAHLALSTLAVVLVLPWLRGAQARLVLALLCAGGGFALASLLNLGAMSVHGDGGRLAYAPLAWLALALGLALSRSDAVDAPPRRLALAASVLAAAAIVGAGVLHAQLRVVRGVQDSARALVAAMPAWAATHAGLTVLVVPERGGQVVALRNAQGAIAMRPFQTQPLLHRVLPTVNTEIQPRTAQLQAGLATSLKRMQPDQLDQPIMAALLAPAPPSAPEHVACWSPAQRAILSGCENDPPDLACAAAACGLAAKP